MKSKKVYITLIIILIVFFLLMYFLIGKDSIEKSKQNLVILTSEDTAFSYSNNTWENIRDVGDRFNWQKFSIYFNQEYKGNNYIWHDDKWYVFDDEKQAINDTGNLLAIKTNYHVEIAKFSTVLNTNSLYVDEVLKEHGIEPTLDFTVNTITEVDLDNDGRDEDIYIVSNMFPIDFEPDLLFAYVFMVKDNKIYMIYESSMEADYYSGCQPYINSIIDVDNDNNYEILLSCSPYSTQKNTDILYKLDKDKFKILISNE